MRRTHQSPFRAPLYKYLNRYPKEIWALLAGKIEDAKYGRFLSQVLQDAESQPLREVAVADVDGLVKLCGGAVAEGRPTRHVAVINTIKVLHALCQFPTSVGWMEKKEHLAWLRQVGRDLERELREIGRAHV